MADENPSPTPAPASVPRRDKPIPEVARELWELVVAYFKQETLVPLKQLGRYVGFGVLGALLIGVGVVFFTVAILRALQGETGDTFTGDLTWIPYFITAVILAIGGGLVWMARGGHRKEAQR